MNLVIRYAIPEWEREPASKQFEYKGYLCIIKRHPTALHLCGYVAIPDFIEGREEYLIDNLYPHGGITYQSNSEMSWLPYQNGHGQVLYWIGFDCAHSSDMSPGYLSFLPYQKDLIYRNIDYVENEIREMVDQIIENIQNNGEREV